MVYINLYNFKFFFLCSSKTLAMEDGNALAADCVVISCCCQCLILQIILFILLKLPYKLIRKTRDFARKKLRERKIRGRMVIGMVEKYKNEFVGIVGESMRFQALDRISMEAGKSGCGSCMKEVEKVMEELSHKGEFAFGSFWCKEEEYCDEISPTCVAKHGEVDDGFVRFQLIKMVGSISCS